MIAVFCIILVSVVNISLVSEEGIQVFGVVVVGILLKSNIALYRIIGSAEFCL